MSTARCLRVATWTSAAIVAATLSASAQITTGTVAGTVVDSSGGVIPGATIVLISESQNTKSTPVVTNTTGDFVFANVKADSYTIEVTMPSFKTLKRSGVTVNPGTRVAIGTLTISAGGVSEVIDVKADAPLIQAQSGERSFAITTESVSNLPIAGRSFTSLAILAPGVELDGNGTPQRIGRGGDPNIMMDGVSTMDTGSNRPLLMMNVESIAEVKVLTSGYQAEYGRASGVQVSAVTKSGTNRFRGSVYDVERNSDWNSNSKQNKLNGSPKNVNKQKDWGYTIGGPIGKPGGNNKLFFFYAQEFAPRTAGNNVVQYRMPTALERAGDFSKTTDQNGALYNFIKDPNLAGNCTATDQTACFRDQGLVGKIPANRLYGVGLNILNMYPMPNCPGSTCSTWTPTSSFNFQLTRPSESILSYQPATRFDYQATSQLRASFKYSAFVEPAHTFNGTIPGFNDTFMQTAPVVNYTASVNYTLSPTTFIESTYGHSENQLAGCAQGQSETGAIFCNNPGGSQGVPSTPFASLANNGLSGLPFLFPDATVLDPGYYAVKALNGLQPEFWDGTRMSKVPTFQWGNRVGNAPPTIGFPGWFNINTTNDFSISLTKVMGRHNLKTGFYNTHSFKAEQTSNAAFGTINFQQDAVGTNPFDTSYGYANAAIGTFSGFTQAQKYVETSSIYNNTEWYVQDNWKATNRMTLDYGLRFVHQQAQYDKLGQASNFLPEKWAKNSAPLLYLTGCTSTPAPGVACPNANRQALDPRTGLLLGPNTTNAIATLVPGTGSQLNGLFLPGEDGLPRATYDAPALRIGPRFGMAYDLTGNQKVVLRGGLGLYFDRPSSTTFSGGVNNPPTSGTITVNYSQLQQLTGAGLTTVGPPSLSAFPRNIELPSSTQWNSEIQMALPWSTSLSVAYTGQHSWNQFSQTNINSLDFGTTFLPSSQDPTLASTTPGAAAYTTNILRPFRGDGSIMLQWQRGWRTYHSIQVSLQRRFKNGVQFGFIDTMGLYDHQQTGARVEHFADGTYALRADQAQADELLGNNNPNAHTMRANFVWDLPDLKASSPTWKAVGLVINDWQLSGIWQGITGGAYTVGFSYSSGGGNANLTGSDAYGARVYVVGDPGAGCSSDIYRQFKTDAFKGPSVGSVGLESGTGYLHGCFQSTLDLAIARNIRLPQGRNIQLRVDMFNAPNQAAITGRSTTMNLTSTTDPTTVTNLPFDAAGNLLPNRVRPNQAGFGAVSSWQNPRTIQARIAFQF